MSAPQTELISERIVQVDKVGTAMKIDAADNAEEFSQIDVGDNGPADLMEDIEIDIDQNNQNNIIMEDQSQSEEGAPPVESAINLEIDNNPDSHKQSQRAFYFDDAQYLDTSALEDLEQEEPHLKKKKIVRKGGSKPRGHQK